MYQIMKIYIKSIYLYKIKIKMDFMKDTRDGEAIKACACQNFISRRLTAPAPELKLHKTV